MAQIEIKGVIGQDYTYKQFITDYANAKGELITLYIDSVGGYVDEGELISEFIRNHSDNFIRVMNSGDVASIASSIFLSLPFEKRFFNLSKGVALIHNPFTTVADGTANDLKTISDELLNTQKNINKYIAQQTGADSDVIAALMDINEPLNESQLRSINFANIIKFEAVALLKKNEMNTKEIEEIIEKKQNSFLDKIMAIFKPEFKAIMLTDANGEMVDFPEVPEGGTVAVGDKVNAPDGEILMADGSKIVVVGGLVSEIIPMEDPNNDVTIELENAKSEIETLKQQLADAQAKAVARETEIKAQLSKFKSEMIAEVKTERGVVENKENRIAGLASKLK